VGAALYGLALLACPVGMGLMMWFMMRGKKAPDALTAMAPADKEELTNLRTEVDRLRASRSGASAQPGEAGVR
jgi:hypothetical protein